MLAQDDIVGVLLDAIRMNAALSLEPLLALLGTLARDLQADYMLHFPKVVARLTSLVDEGGLFPTCLLKHACCSLVLWTLAAALICTMWSLKRSCTSICNRKSRCSPGSPTGKFPIPGDCSAGAHAEPEILQHIFECLALICKHLVKQLAADLPQVLRTTARLRHHQADHVRRLAASTLAYLFRHATSLQLRTGVRIVLAGPPLAILIAARAACNNTHVA